MDVKKIVNSNICTTKEAGYAVKFIAEDGSYYFIALVRMLEAYYGKSAREDITVNIPNPRGFNYWAEWIDRGTYDVINFYKDKEQVAYYNMDKNFLGNLSRAFYQYIPEWAKLYE